MEINSSVSGGGPKPTPRSFGEGRLLLVIPMREQTGTEYGDKNKPKQEMVCDVVVLPDPRGPQAPILFGGKARADGSMETPDTHRVEVGPQGWHIPNVILSSGGMMWTLRRVLERTATTGIQQAIVGRLWRDHSPEARGAWKIGPATNDANDPHKATDAEIAAAANWYAAMSTSQFTNSVPVPLAPAIPQQAPAGFNPYGQPAAPQGYPQAAAQPQQPYNPQAQQPYNPQAQQPYNPQAQQPYNPQPYAPQDYPQPQGGMPYGAAPAAPQAGYNPQAHAPQSAPPAAPQGPDLSVPPQGVDPETWARWDDNARRGFYAHAAAQGHPAQAGQPTGY